MYLTDDDIENTILVISDSLFPKEKRTSNNDKLSLDSDVLNILIFQILLPIITSVCASKITDVLKKRSIKSMTKKELLEEVKKHRGKKIYNKLQNNDRIMMIELANEYGIAPSTVDDIFNKVNNHLKKRKVK